VVHASQIAELEGELAKEVQDYTDYHLWVRHRFHMLHEVLEALLGDVRVRCLPFPAKNAPVVDYINWFEEEVKAVPGMVWQLNDNFVVLAIEGVLNMLHSSSCQELPRLHELVVSSDASIVENVPMEVQKAAGRLFRRWWKNHGLPEALRRLEVGNAGMVSDVGTLRCIFHFVKLNCCCGISAGGS
jgi:hypothetical protein